MFYDKFKQLCDQKGVSAKRAVTEMGMSNSLATKWKNTEATPSSTTLKKVADYFGVSVAYLLGTEEKPAATEGNGLSEEERKFIEWYRSQASEKDKALVRMIVEGEK